MDYRPMGYRSLGTYDDGSSWIAVNNDAILNIDLPIDLNGCDFPVRTPLVGPNNSQWPHENIPIDFYFTNDLGGRVNQRRGIYLWIIACQVRSYVVVL